MSHAPRHSGRCVPRENRRATLRIVGIPHGSINCSSSCDGAAAETRGTGTVEHDQKDSQTARKSPGISRELKAASRLSSRDSEVSSWFCRFARRSSASNQREQRQTYGTSIASG
jgi:hypothetical protein